MNARRMLRVQNSQSSGSGHRLPVIFAHHFSRGGQPDVVDYSGTKVRRLFVADRAYYVLSV